MGWRRLIGCLKSQVISHKRANNYRALLWKITYKDKASYASMPPCNHNQPLAEQQSWSERKKSKVSQPLVPAPCKINFVSCVFSWYVAAKSSAQSGQWRWPSHEITGWFKSSLFSGINRIIRIIIKGFSAAACTAELSLDQEKNIWMSRTKLGCQSERIHLSSLARSRQKFQGSGHSVVFVQTKNSNKQTPGISVYKPPHTQKNIDLSIYVYTYIYTYINLYTYVQKTH